MIEIPIIVVTSMSIEIKVILFIMFLPVLIAVILIPLYLPFQWIQKRIDMIDREIYYFFKRFGITYRYYKR